VPAADGRAGHRFPWIPLGLILLVLLAYGQVANHEFVEFDDSAYVSRNPHVTSGLTWQGLRWSWTTFQMGNWHPLTWSSHMLDCELFGLNAGAHHLVSVLIHAASAVLLYLALMKMTRASWPAAWVAALFALHPTHVESVAWAAERKDVLSALFWMLTLLAYARYASEPTLRRYVWVVGGLALGLLSKPMLVTLPCVLLLLDVWPLGRLRFGSGRRAGGGVAPARLILEKLPLFALAAAGAVTTLVAQRSVGAVGALEALPFGMRLQNAVTSYGIYLWQTLWPRGLSFYYPHPALAEGAGVSTIAVWGLAILLGAISLAALATLRRRPYLGVGWFWFVGTLVPVIGLLQVGMQAHADRYTYLPSVGLFIAVAWAAREWAERSPGSRPLLATAGVLVVVGCLVTSWIQTGHWRDSRTLAEHALTVNERNFWAHNMLGVVQHEEREYAASEASYRRALEIKPDFGESQLNLAALLGDRGFSAEAAELFRLALRLYPEQAGLRAHNGLGALMQKQGDLEGALGHLQQAVSIDPQFPEAQNNLGVVFEGLGRIDDARAAFERTLEISPDYALAHRNLAGILQRQGDAAGAVAHLLRALVLDPEMAEARLKLGAIYAGQGRLAESAREFETLLELAPDLPVAHYNLGRVLGAMGQTERARFHLQRVLVLDPEYVAARQALESLR
jgi:tetratricopeptide (TPR) repeat protein